MDVDLVEVGQSLPGRVQHREPRANAVGGCGVAGEEIGRGAHRKVRAGGAGGFLGGVDEPGEPLRAVQAGRGLGGEQGEFGSQCAVPAASRGVGRGRDLRCQLLVGDVGGQRPVPYGLDGVVHDPRESRMTVAALGPAGVVHQRGGQQPGREGDRPVLRE